MTLKQRVETANKQLDELAKSQNGTVSLGQLWKIWSDNQIATVMVSTLVGLVLISFGLVVAFFGGSEEHLTIGETCETSPSLTKKQPTKSARIPICTFNKIRHERLLQVNSSQVLESIGGVKSNLPTQGGKLIAVYMTIKNVNNESGNIFWSDFQLLDFG